MAEQLREYRQVAQVDGEPPRRWFWDEAFDLIVWHGEDDGNVIGFELRYGPREEQLALTWWADRGYHHFRIDEGDGDPRKMKVTRLFADAGPLDKQALANRFAEYSQSLDPALAQVVLEHIAGYTE